MADKNSSLPRESLTLCVFGITFSYSGNFPLTNLAMNMISLNSKVSSFFPIEIFTSSSTSPIILLISLTAFAGRIISFSTFPSPVLFLINFASLLPSVATAVISPFFTWKRIPPRAYRVSSRETANDVFFISCFIIFWGTEKASFPPDSGSFGNSSFGNPIILKELFPQFIFIAFPFSVEISILSSGTSRTISLIVRPGTVMLPSS